MRVNILGIPFDTTTEESIIEAINSVLTKAERGGEKNQQIFIATPNPEMVLEAQKNEELYQILNDTNINIPDGTGILWAADFLESAKGFKSRLARIMSGLLSLPLMVFKANKSKRSGLYRVTGTDIMQKICRDALPSARIFLLGAAPGVAQKAKNKLQKQYNCTIVGVDAGAAHPQEYHRIREVINTSKPDILFVAFGAPKQEIWLARSLPHLKTVKVAIGVGGAFDFISGHIPRAPKLMRKFGLEWLFRLFYQPSRVKRIYNATIKFPIRVIRASLRQK